MLAHPDIDPVAFAVGPFAVRWHQTTDGDCRQVIISSQQSEIDQMKAALNRLER
jgi:hypothetical protein